MGVNATQNLLDDYWKDSVEALLLKTNNSIISIFLLFIFILRLPLVFLFSHLSLPCLIFPLPLPQFLMVQHALLIGWPKSIEKCGL